MVTQSNYHGWDIPEINADEDLWGDYLRNTLADGPDSGEFRLPLDDAVILKDTFLNRPASAKEGRWFLATDTLELYYDTGSGWDRVLDVAARVDESENITGDWTFASGLTLGGDLDISSNSIVGEDGVNEVDPLEPYYRNAGERGWKTSIFRVTGGRFDFDGADGKTEMRIQTPGASWSVYHAADNRRLIQADANGDVNISNGVLSEQGTPVLTEADAGAGNGLNADTVDGYQGDALAAIAEAETITGAWNFASGLTGDLRLTDDDAVISLGPYNANPDSTVSLENTGTNGGDLRVSTSGGTGTNNVIEFWDARIGQVVLEIAEQGEVTIPVGPLDVGDGTIEQIEKLAFTGDAGSDSVEFNGSGSTDLRFRNTGTVSDQLTLYSNGFSEFSGGLSVSGNGVLTTADEGEGNGLDADTLDSVHREDMVGNQRYHAFQSGGTTSFVKLVELKDPSRGTDGGGGVRLVADFAADRGSSPVRTISMTAFAKGAGFTAEHIIESDSSNDPLDFVITEETGATADDYQYHIYARVKWAATGVRVTPGNWFGSHDFQQGLSSGDLTGSIVYDTAVDDPSRPFDLGPITSEGSPVLTESDKGQNAIDSPNYGASITLDENGASNGGDNYFHPIPVPDGETLTVYSWGVQVSDGTQPTDLDIELKNPDRTTTVVSKSSSLISGYEEDATGITSYSNTSGSFETAYIRIDNDSATAYDGVGSNDVVEWYASVVVE